jgi:hypothetical protein
VRQLLEIAFAHLGMDYRDYVETDPAFLRPAEVYHLLGDASKARQELGWKPKVGFEELVKMMVDEDLARLDAGHSRPSGNPSSKQGVSEGLGNGFPLPRLRGGQVSRE